MADPTYVTTNYVTQSGNVTELTVSIPSGVPGEVYILQVGHGNDATQYGATYTLPTDAFPVDIAYDATPSRRQWLRGRVCDGKEPATVTVTVTGGTNFVQHSTAVHIFRNTAGLALEGSNFLNGSSAAPSDRSVTTTRPNRLACNFMLLGADLDMPSWTGETGGDWTLVWQTATGRGRLSIQTALLASAGTIGGGSATLGSSSVYTIRGLAFLPGANGVATGTVTSGAAATGAASAQGTGNGDATSTLHLVGRLLLAGAATGAAAGIGAAVGSTVIAGVGVATGASASSGSAVGAVVAAGVGGGAATATGAFVAPPISAVATGAATLSGSFDGRTNIPPYLRAALINSQSFGALFLGIMRGHMAGLPVLVPGEPPPVIPAPGVGNGGGVLLGTGKGALGAAGTATGRARLRGNWDNHRRPTQNRLAIVMGIWR